MKIQPGPRKQGISLFITMSALMILSVLTLSVTAQIMAPTLLSTSITAQNLQQNTYRSALQLLHPLIRAAANGTSHSPNLPTLDGRPFTLEINGQPHSFTIQDVNGLIDVNAASSAMLASLLQAVDMAEALPALQARRSTAPFQSTKEFLDALGAAQDTSRLIAPFLTIHSGRRRLNPQTTPLGLLHLLSNQTGRRAIMLESLDPRLFRTRPIVKVRVERNPETSGAS